MGTTPRDASRLDFFCDFFFLSWLDLASSSSSSAAAAAAAAAATACGDVGLFWVLQISGRRPRTKGGPDFYIGYTEL
tara:strand:+ start:5567 stop:5797 length:231 start_codon:yes stop_codon:yes gene_type:complete